MNTILKECLRKRQSIKSIWLNFRLNFIQNLVAPFLLNTHKNTVSVGLFIFHTHARTHTTEQRMMIAMHVYVNVFVCIVMSVLAHFRCSVDRCVCVSTANANVYVGCMYVNRISLHIYTQTEQQQQQQHSKYFKESLIGRLNNCVVQYMDCFENINISVCAAYLFV